MPRILEIVISCCGLILLSPLMLLIMLLLAVSQKRVFFRQTRPGKDEVPFNLIKFSTMRDRLPEEKEEDNQRARLTFWGRYLRASSLDELPQLLNVLKGDMSLVGPRPLLLSYLPLYSDEQRRRHEVRPGITGWAQVKGRNSLSFTERFKLDVWYVENKSLSLDLRILWMTVIQLFRPSGVYRDDATTSPLFDGTN